MTDVTIQAQADSGWVKVFINGDEVLSGPGAVVVPLPDGVHYLTYFVQGRQGENYLVAITDPADDQWAVQGSLKTNHTTGQHAIIIP